MISKHGRASGPVARAVFKTVGGREGVLGRFDSCLFRHSPTHTLSENRGKLDEPRTFIAFYGCLWLSVVVTSKKKSMGCSMGQAERGELGGGRRQYYRLTAQAGGGAETP